MQQLLPLVFHLDKKKEISAAFKAIETNDTATANTQIGAADAILGGKTYLLEPPVFRTILLC